VRVQDDCLNEREALERHARILEGQNADLTAELDRFVQTDELLRTQLDRRSRIQGLQYNQHNERSHSNYKVQEARSRSPTRHSPLRR
jgi:hypothetical protein